METLGEHLRRRREEQGISLEDIESVTKISLAYLRDIEENRFERLPAPIFTLGFLKQVAECVGLDPQEIVLRYRRELCQEGTPLGDGVIGKSWSVRRRAFWVLLGLVCVLVLLWALLSPRESQQERVRSIRFPRATEREWKKQQFREQLNLEALGGAARGVGTEDGTADGSALDLPAALDELGPVAVTLQALRGTRVTWSVDGEAALSRALRSGERMSWEAQDSLRLEIASGDAVRVFYRGEVYEHLGRKGEVVHMVFPPAAR